MSTDIFISYAREDLVHANRLAEALTTLGWSVWWDRRIRPGLAFDRVIEDACVGCVSVVVVLWSKPSVNSDWVRAEAEYGLETNKLVPVLIEDIRPPLRFRRLQTPSLAVWDGTRAAAILDPLKAELTERLGAPARGKRRPAVNQPASDQSGPGAGRMPAARAGSAPAAPPPSTEDMIPAQHAKRRRALHIIIGFWSLAIVLAGAGVAFGPTLYERISGSSQREVRLAMETAADEASARQAQQQATNDAAARQAQQKAAAEAAARQAQQKAADEASARQAQQKAAADAAARQAQQKAADEAAARQAQQKAAAEAAARQAQQKAAAEAAARQAQQKAADEAAARQAQQKAADEAAARQAQQKAAVDAAARQAQQKAADEAAARQAQQKAAAEAAARQADQQKAASDGRDRRF